MASPTRHELYALDCRYMHPTQDASVQLIITSPPYWQLKDYDHTDQIGFNQSYETYINNLNLVWQECYRVLEPGCRLCINIGDQFARAESYGRYKVIPIRTEIIRFCETLGFDYMGAIIWQKKTTLNTSGGASIMGSYPFPRNGILELDYEFILLFKKPGTHKRVDREVKAASKMEKEEWKTYFSGHWHFAGERQKGHIAMFPEELPKRLIKMFSFIGETVLDPFMGSGTTALAAHKLQRNSIGYEINPQFIKIAQEKLRSKEGVPALDLTLYSPEPKRRKNPLKRLPYLFKDPHAMALKHDPKKQKYGSKVGIKTEKREQYFRVEKVISPELIALKKGPVIRLIGIKTELEKEAEAHAFLNLKLSRTQVYLRFEPHLEKDSDGNHYAYLYLKNRTFINRHLIKQNLCALQPNLKLSKKLS